MKNEEVTKSIETLAKMFGADRMLTQTDLDKILGAILKMLTEFKKSTETLNSETKDTVDNLLTTILDKYEAQNKDITTSSVKIQKEFSKTVEDLKYLIEETKKIVPQKGDDGVSPLISDIVDEVIAKLELPENKQEEITGETIIDKINELDFSEDNQIDWDRIKNIPANIFATTDSKGGMRSPTVLSMAVDLDHSTRADTYAIVWDATAKRHKYAASGGGGGGSGTVNSGTQYRLAYYATTGTAVSQASAITGSRVLVSDTNGVPTHSTVTTTTLGYLDATSSIQTQLNAKQGTITTGTTSQYFRGDLSLATFPTAVSSFTNDSGYITSSALSPYALLSGTLAQFAATTSAQLIGVMSDETGTGALVFATSPTLVTPILGTPTSGTLTNCTGLPIAGLVASTSTAIGVGTIELGHASDTTLARSSAGVVTIEGVVIDTISAANTLTNKTLTTPVINGLATGTGVASAATVSTIMTRDSNGLANVVNLNEGYTTTATAAGTTTLTVASNNMQYFTGSTTQTVTMPVTSTLVLGQSWWIINNSTGAVTVNSSGANAIVVLPAGTCTEITCILTSGTSAASWNAQYFGDVYTSGKKLSVTNTLTLSGTDATTITFQGTDTYVGRATTDTLTNKTLTAPRFADLGFIADSNGNELIIFDLVASAVNELTIGNNTTGNAPFISATGGDTNIDLNLIPKGTGIVKGTYERFSVRLIDSATAITTGTSKGGDFRISSKAITVKKVGAYVDTAPTGASLLTIDINEAGTTIMSTNKVTLDASEKTSETAATAPAVTDTAIAADAIVTFDVDQVGSTVAGSGLVVWIEYVYA